MIQKTAITFDVDWAPDWAIALSAEICVKRQVPATFFVTHPSDAADEIGRANLFELGIHPNFLPGTTQGGSEEEILEYCLNLAPSAKAMRTHALVQSTPLLALIGDQFPQIETDTSVLLFGHDYLQPVDVFFGQKKRRITRLPFYWEDDVAADHPGWKWDADVPCANGLMIFNFHPIHIALNTSSMTQCARLRSTLGERKLNQLTEKDVEPFVERNHGARTFLEAVLDSAPPQSFSTISPISDSFRCAN